MKKRLKKKLLQKALTAGAGRVPQSPSLDEETCKTLAIEVWRLKRSLQTLPPGTNTGSFGVSIDRLEQLLRTMEIEVHDPSGESYDEGMTLSVRLFEKSKALPNGIKRIAETISPTVYRKGRMLQPGTVIVEIGDWEG
jgi:hypothetical protein